MAAKERQGCDTRKVARATGRLVKSGICLATGTPLPTETAELESRFKPAEENTISSCF